MAAPPEIARANGMKGGRPPGRKNQATLEREAALARFQERVRKSIDPLFDSQMTIARGCSYLFRVKKSKHKDEKPELVKDVEEIQGYLEGEFDEDPDYPYSVTYI
jgi:hypothetical protein